RIGRLDIVMSVEEDGRLVRRAKPLRAHQRVSLAFDQFGSRHTGGAKFIPRELGRAANVRLVLGESADGRNAKEGLKALQERVVMVAIIGHAALVLVARSRIAGP